MQGEIRHTGVLLINLGTPASARPRDVRRYLREFLSDARVLDMNPLLRGLLLHGIILPFRTRRSAHAYAKIWTAEGSPLRLHGEALSRGVQVELGSAYRVELAMRYGTPSIASALQKLERAGARQLVVLPLFPQYSAAATGSALARVYELLASGWDVPAVSSIDRFYDQPGYVQAVAAAAKPLLTVQPPDHVLISFHGLPERQLKRSDASGAYCLAAAGCCDEIRSENRGCYRAQCFATARLLATALDLKPEGWSTSFQSRLGRTAWIQPYTDRSLEQLAARGVRRLAVLCPSFVADCLETLEEIGIRARQRWRELGGEHLLLLPCPNTDPLWVSAVADLVRAATQARISSAARRPEANASGRATPSR